LDVFSITDIACIAINDALKAVAELKEDSSDSRKKDTVGKCWTIITSSLHDDLFIKLVHVEPGRIETLMAEIRSALLVNIAEDVQPVRLELYSASMQRDCNNDLQSFIAYIIQRRDKLLFLKVKIPDEELVHIFLKGLPAIFQALQLHYAIPGNTPASLETLIATTRRYASTPIVASELAKLKSSGLSQNIFTSISRSHATPKTKQYCYRFSKTGSCSFGEKCRFYHATNNGSSTAPPRATSESPKSSIECSYCHFKGHSIEECRKRARNNATLAAVSEEKNDLSVVQAHEPSVDDPFIFVVTANHKRHRNSGWVLDSGATQSATYDINDCVDVVDCNVSITGAGCAFAVSKKGTAIITVLNDVGKEETIRIRDCLISDKFPYKLLALQSFTKKGHSVLMTGDSVAISNKRNDFVISAWKDPTSRLYFLSQKEIFADHARSAHGPAVPANQLFLAKSYTGGVTRDLLWKLHLRHGHKNFEDVCRQYNLPVPRVIPPCTSCVMGKSHLHPYISSGFTRATRPGEGFHSDFRGPFACPTPSGHVYLLTIIDDFSRRIFPFLVKSQSEWLGLWIKFVTRVEAEFGKSNCVSWLMSDNGAVYKSHDMAAFCAQKGIQQRHSAPYSQFMDHTAERNMRTIGEMLTTTMLHANLPKKSWGWAALHAAEVINRSAESSMSNKTAGMPSNSSRLERWKKIAMPTQTKGLFPFGCLAFKFIPGVLRTKLDAHAIPCVYLGLDASSRAFLLGSLYELATSVSVEVTFFENVFPFRKLKQDSPSSLLWETNPVTNTVDPRLGVFDTRADDSSRVVEILDSGGAQSTSESLSVSPLPFSDPIVPSTSISTPTVPSSMPDNTTTSRPRDFWLSMLGSQSKVEAKTQEPLPLSSSVSVAPSLRRSSRLSSRSHDSLILQSESIPVANEESSLICVSEATLDKITPRGARQALSSSLADMWLLAMNREKACHVKNKTFGIPTEPPLNAKIIPADWIYRVKYRGGPVDTVELKESNFKARVVMRGQFMKEGLQFNDTFAPVAKPATLRAVLAIAAKFKCILMSGDVETAFLNAHMDCEVWVRLPPYWGKGDDCITHDDPHLAPCLLLKGVPGIPQGSRLFYQTFAAHLLTMGYIPSNADSCLFINPKLKERNAVILWVDDFVYMCEKASTYDSFIAALRTAFNIPNAGVLVSFLGMRIVRDIPKGLLFFSQENSIDVLLERANMSDCNPTPTPCVAGAVFSKKDCPISIEDNTTSSNYRSLIAMANFVACWSRPDIVFIVNKLCKYMGNPGDIHWRHLKHLLRYLRGTKNLGVCYDYSTSQPFTGLHAYSDSSFADCPDTSRSTLAYVFLFGNAILSWYSKLNSYVTTCTNHAEYNALALCAKEAEWMLSLFNQLLPEILHSPLPILVDNSGVVSMLFNPVDHAANKHVKIACHYSRELVTSRTIIPQRVASETNLADLFTKSLSTSIFKKLSSTFMSIPAEDESILMMHADSPNDSDSEDVTVHTGFRQDWPYASKMKEELGASSYLIADNGKFKTGRTKLIITFVRLDKEGVSHIISRHDAMQLLSKAGNTYIVCKRTPLPIDQQESTADFTETFATINLKSPNPALVCNTCGFHNTKELALLQCTSCNGSKFDWSCGCIPVEAKVAPPKPPAKPKRDASSLKSWVTKIKYQAPIRRGTLFHQLDCNNAPLALSLGTTEFATAMHLVPAPCCNSAPASIGGSC
jgi:hypothetical protein